MARFNKFLVGQLKCALVFSLALGLLCAVAILAAGQIHGSVQFDLDLTSADSIWFVLGTPIVVAVLFLLCSPISYALQRAGERLFSRGEGPVVD